MAYVKSKIGDGITSGAQLHNFIKSHPKLDRAFSGIIAIKPYNMLKYLAANPLKNNTFLINNDKMHWMAIYRDKNGEYKEYDSYNRDMYPDIEEDKVNIMNVQGKAAPDSSDCGARVLAKMMNIFNI